MKQIMALASSAVLICCIMAGGPASAAGSPGETLFKQHCTACHPDGGNIINPQKTLHKKDREKNKVMGANDIIKVMRKPGPGMSKFEKSVIPDKDAHKIAEYVISTFK